MNLLWIFFTSFFVAFSGALSPCPLLAVTIAETYKNGVKTGPLLISGHAFLEFLLISIFFTGITQFLKNQLVFKIVAFFGCLVLIYMGFSMLIKKGLYMKEKGGKKNFSLPLKGIIASLSNPYWFLWWLTIGLTYFTISLKFGVKGVFLFFVGHILADFLWYSIVSVALWKNKKFIRENIYVILCNICGVFLMGFSFFLFFKFIL